MRISGIGDTVQDAALCGSTSLYDTEAGICVPMAVDPGPGGDLQLAVIGSTVPPAGEVTGGRIVNWSFLPNTTTSWVMVASAIALGYVLLKKAQGR